MSNDPKDTVADLSKLVRSPIASTSKNIYTYYSKKFHICNATSCNEGTELIGNEYFTYNGENKDSKND